MACGHLISGTEPARSLKYQTSALSNKRESGVSNKKERRGEVETSIRDKKGIRQGKALFTIVSLASRSGIVAKAEIFHRLSFGIVGDCVGPSGCTLLDGGWSHASFNQEAILCETLARCRFFEGRRCLRRAAL